jgi:5-methyltetrahydropteroyltriglutamate--homocysteine methyltransferase
MFGCIDNGTESIETPQSIADKLLAAAEHLPAEQIQAAPDCGLVPLPLSVARAKLITLAAGARLARTRIDGGTNYACTSIGHPEPDRARFKTPTSKHG